MDELTKRQREVLENLQQQPKAHIIYHSEDRQNYLHEHGFADRAWVYCCLPGRMNLAGTYWLEPAWGYKKIALDTFYALLPHLINYKIDSTYMLLMLEYKAKPESESNNG